MRDTNLVNALREHAEWARANEWETPITLLALFSLLWKMKSIERRLKRLCELLEGEGDDGED